MYASCFAWAFLEIKKMVFFSWLNVYLNIMVQILFALRRKYILRNNKKAEYTKDIITYIIYKNVQLLCNFHRNI